MAVFKCKMCGGTIEFEPGASVGVCDSCGTKQTLPRLDDDRRANLYDRANHFRRNNDFDKAASIYEQILNEDPTDAEAYWSLVLCRYGIEYVEDPETRRRVPTVNRAQYTSIFDDADYQSALKNADAYQRAIYEAEANAINELQKGILAISQKEEPFDVFICYKETDAQGRRTPDSVLANDLYHQLTQEGFKVFFSRITLEDKLGTAYEPYIFAALNSAKVMVVLGTRPEYFKAVWVRNEWSRYLTLVKQSGGKKTLIPAYKDMDPYDLPDEFSHLQAQDMSKLGFMQDLIRGIRKLAGADAPKQAVVKEAAAPVVTGGTAAAPLLERAFMFLEDGKWTEADEYCEKVLDIEPKNARAYLGKLMAELRIRREDALCDAAQPFDGRDNCVKAARFDPALAEKLAADNAHIRERNERARLTGIYNGAVKAMKAAHSENAYKAAAKQFKSIPGFKDADALAKRCLERAEECRKDAVYDSAKSKMTGETTDGYEAAIREFGTISGWKDADEQISACRRRIEAIKAKAEADRLEAERKAEAERLEAERKAEEERIKREKRMRLYKRAAAIGLPILAAVIVLTVLTVKVFIPLGKYNAAVRMYENGQFDEAITAFKALDGYKDSAEQIKLCETGIKENKYNAAVKLYEDGKFEEAIATFKALNGYKDSTTQITKCETAIKDEKYNSAVELSNAGKYEEAITAFKALNGYKDSTTQITKCETAIKDEKYNSALELIEKGEIVNAYESLIALNGYRDSAEKAKDIFGKYKIEKLKTASVGDIVYFGAYEQDNNTSNGKEDVEWLVLAKEGDKALVISKYALDCRQYNTSDTGTTWETCSLRKWLNGTFLNAAFSSEEQNSIISSTVTADKNPSFSTTPGNNTTDKIFLLSITEVIKYFSSGQCHGTAYCHAQGAYKGDNGYCCWWLRSPGYKSRDATYVNSVGSVDNYGYFVSYDEVAVRPAMWISLA